MQIFYINHSANFFLYCMTGQRFRTAMWSLCRCRTSEFDRFSTDPAMAYLAAVAKFRNSSSPALKLRKSTTKDGPLWGSTPAVNYLVSTGQLQNKNLMAVDPIHRKSSPAILLDVQNLRRESIVWIPTVQALHRSVTLLYLAINIVTFYICFLHFVLDARCYRVVQT